MTDLDLKLVNLTRKWWIFVNFCKNGLFIKSSIYRDLLFSIKNGKFRIKNQEFIIRNDG